MSKCWEWPGKISAEGYGRAGISYAHRLVYISSGGTIPEGYAIDHLRRNRKCVNPEHLEAVSVAENLRRGLNGNLKVTCKNGHPYFGDNVINRPEGRCCRICKKQRDHQRWITNPWNKQRMPNED